MGINFGHYCLKFRYGHQFRTLVFKMPLIIPAHENQIIVDWNEGEYFEFLLF